MKKKLRKYKIANRKLRLRQWLRRHIGHPRNRVELRILAEKGDTLYVSSSFPNDAPQEDILICLHCRKCSQYYVIDGYGIK